MKKLIKTLLLIYIFYIIYYMVFRRFRFTTLDKRTIEIISVVFLILPFFLSLLIKNIVKRQNNEVNQVSEKIQKLLELNNNFNFKEISKIEHYIRQREYSRKSLDRVTEYGVIRYHIENNIDQIRTDIENAIYNINLLNEYNKQVEKLSSLEFNNKSKYSLKKFKKIECRIFNNLIYKKEEFLINLYIEAYYVSNGGNVHDSRRWRVFFDRLVEIYNEWENGNKYKETIKQERQIINDDTRFNVFKRDNFTCQICGATAKDGATLHVDHIMPVSLSGKSTMDNLQTLCDRCNIGKSNKTDDDFKNNLICPNCGGKLVKRKGKYGEFIGCSNFPNCDYTKNIDPTKSNEN